MGRKLLIHTSVFFLAVCFIARVLPKEGSDVHGYEKKSFHCGSMKDCLDSEFRNITSTLVKCVSGKCVCRQCFSLKDGKCGAVCSRYTYNFKNQTCGEDLRPKQQTALLLSIFLSPIGAANFYIGRIRLGIGQLFLFIGTILSFCCGTCGCILSFNSEDYKTAGSGLTICGLLSWGFIGSLGMVFWGIADIVIFSLNVRLSGENCILA